MELGCPHDEGTRRSGFLVRDAGSDLALHLGLEIRDDLLVRLGGGAVGGAGSVPARRSMPMSVSSLISQSVCCFRSLRVVQIRLISGAQFVDTSSSELSP